MSAAGRTLIRPLTGVATRAGRQGGYTLIELVVVSALIAAMLAIAMPALSPGSFGDPLKSAARRTIALVNEVRAEARLARQERILHVDIAAGRIWYVVEERGADGDSPQRTERALDLPPEVRITGFWLGGEDLLPLTQAEVWVSGHGYLEELLLHFEDDSGQVITLGFAPFHEVVTVSDQLLAAEG